MLMVIRKDTNEVIWKDDITDFEGRNKAKDFITYKGLYIEKKERVDGNLIFWVLPL